MGFGRVKMKDEVGRQAKVQSRDDGARCGDMWFIELEVRGSAYHSKREGRKESWTMPLCGASITEWIMVLRYEVGGMRFLYDYVKVS